jgi:hypothetical protein
MEWPANCDLNEPRSDAAFAFRHLVDSIQSHFLLESNLNLKTLQELQLLVGKEKRFKDHNHIVC